MTSKTNGQRAQLVIVVNDDHGKIAMREARTIQRLQLIHGALKLDTR